MWLHDDWDEFGEAHPEAVSPTGRKYPLRLSHVAAGRAAGELGLEIAPPSEDDDQPRREHALVRIDEIANRKS